MDFLIPILNTLVIAAVFILLMVGLVSAPWQVLLLILVLGILAYQWLIHRHHLEGVLKDINQNLEADAAMSPEEPASHTNPSSNQVLHYRGASYMTSAAPPESELPHTLLEMTGQYRGGVRKFLP